MEAAFSANFRQKMIAIGYISISHSPQQFKQFFCQLEHAVFVIVFDAG